MEGSLDQTPVPEVVQSFTASGRSGVLHLSRGSTTKRIYFRDGAIVFASSDDTAERLGERLVRAGALKPSELELACRVLASSHLRLGATLVEMGYLSTDELDRRVKEQITSIVHSLFPWESGVFRAEIRDRPIAPDLERNDLSTRSLLMEGVRRIEDVSTIRRGLGDLEGALSYALDPAKLQNDLDLTPAEGFVLSRVDGATSPGEIAKLSPLGEDETLRCVYALVAAGILEVRGVERPAISVSPPQESELSPEALRFLEEMREKRQASVGNTLYQLLEIEPSATPDAVKAAYFRLAKRLHPDHRAGLKVADADGVLDDLYLRVKDAYEVLSSETERRRYDFALCQKVERQARADATAAANPAPKGRSQPSAPASAVDPGSKKTFTTSQTARIHFGNGEKYFGDGRYHEAIEELRTAVRLDPSRAEYHRALGRALSKNPRWRKQAEDAFSKALELNRFDADSYVGLGELYHDGGLETRAKKMFEEALAVDPDNARALERLGSHRSESSPFARLRRLRGIMKRSRGQ
jgi:curved DNA-binding protein CbpA